MFSNLSPSSISLATVTPSLVMRGAPKDLSSTTLRPLGPRVTLTALARISTPRNMRSRASLLNRTSLAGIAFPPCFYPAVLRRSGGLALLGAALDHAEHIRLLHDDQLFAVDLDLA